MDLYCVQPTSSSASGAKRGCPRKSRAGSDDDGGDDSDRDEKTAAADEDDDSDREVGDGMPVGWVRKGGSARFICPSGTACTSTLPS